MLFTSTLDEDFSSLLEDTFSSLEELSTTLLEECFSTPEELSVMLLDGNSTFKDDELFEVLLEETDVASKSSSLETVGVEQAAKNAIATQAKDILKKAFFTP